MKIRLVFALALFAAVDLAAQTPTHRSGFSIEGSAGLSYSSTSQRCEFNGIVSNFRQHSLSTFRSALSITFYF